MVTHRHTRGSKSRTRRVAIAMAIVTGLGLSAGLTGTASATKFPIGSQNCNDGTFKTFSSNNANGNHTQTIHGC